MAGSGAPTTVIIPTLVRDEASLARSVDSSTPDADVVVVVDGDAPVPSEVAAAARVVRTPAGSGFAMTAQTGIDSANGRYVALLNDDAWFEPGALQAMQAALDDDGSAAGCAPKVRFSRWPGLLNSVGTVLFGDGRSDSRGIGQPDLGQYDRPQRVFGLHFAAAIIRRELFGPQQVGPLDTSFGTYYEDVDWCLRANLLGHRFVTSPAAVAWHEHSATAGTMAQGFSFLHQQRNLVWTALKCFEAPRAAAVAARRAAGLTKRRLTVGGQWVVPSIAGGLRRVLSQRRALQRSRRVPDAEIIALSAGERVWFEAGEGPVVSLDCLVDALSKLDPSLGARVSVAVRAGRGVAAELEAAPGAARAYLETIEQPAGRGR